MAHHVCGVVEVHGEMNNSRSYGVENVFLDNVYDNSFCHIQAFFAPCCAKSCCLLDRHHKHHPTYSIHNTTFVFKMST